MSKLAHSHQPSMDEIEFDRLRRDGLLPHDYVIAAELTRHRILNNEMPEKQRKAIIAAYWRGFQAGVRFEP